MELIKSDSWVIEQLATIGSTAAGAIANESPYQTPAGLYDVMINAQSGQIKNIKLNDDMRRGLLTEPLHRQLLEDEISKVVHDHDQDKFIYNELYPWAHALPDGWILENGNEIPVQLKCPRIRSWNEIKLKGIHSYWLLGTQHSIAVCNALYEHFSVLNPETFRLIQFPVYRDDELITRLMEMEEKFYNNFLNKKRPDEDEPEKIEMPPLTGKLITIVNDEAIEAATAYRESKELFYDAKELMALAEKRIKELMGDAEVADLPGLRVYHRLQPGRKTLNKNAMESDGIELGKYYKEGKPYDWFRAFYTK